MRALMTLTAALLAATAIVSSASAESEIGADAGLSTTAVQTSAERFWDPNQRLYVDGTQAYAAAPMPRAYGQIIREDGLPPRKTGVSGGND
jgi:hypothetical protein